MAAELLSPPPLWADRGQFLSDEAGLVQEVKCMPTNVLAADLWPVFNFDNANVRYQKFIEKGKPAFGKFLESILLHDRIVVPTDDFMSLSVLLGVFGEKPVCELIESRVLRFLRIHGALAYMGNGVGIKSFEMSRSEAKHAFCAPLQETINWATNGVDISLDDDKILGLVHPITQEIKLSTIDDEIKRETYMDVLNSDILRNVFALRNVNMDRLQGIGPKNVRIYGGPYANDLNDEISAVLKLAHANIEIKVAALADCQDSSTSSPIGHLLKAKAKRTIPNTAFHEKFSILVEIANLPDVPNAVINGKIEIEDLIRLRNSRNGEQFREWFHENCSNDPVATGREYATLLKSIPKSQDFPAKMLRFLVTQAIGSIPGAGLVVGAIDSFLVDRIARGTSPKYFLESLARSVQNS